MPEIGPAHPRCSFPPPSQPPAACRPLLRRRCHRTPSMDARSLGVLSHWLSFRARPKKEPDPANQGRGLDHTRGALWPRPVRGLPPAGRERARKCPVQPRITGTCDFVIVIAGVTREKEKEKASLLRLIYEGPSGGASPARDVTKLFVSGLAI